MTTTFFGFAISDSMFNGNVELTRKVLTPEEVRAMAEAGLFTPCLNPSHKATIDAMTSRYGIQVDIPEVAPRCSLNAGDSIVVMQVRGLPRLDATRHEYTAAEIAIASFTFAKWTVK